MMRVGIDWCLSEGDLWSRGLYPAQCCSTWLPTLELCGISITYFMQRRLVYTNVDLTYIISYNGAVVRQQE